MKRDYPCIEINLGKIKHNAETIVDLCGEKGIHLVGVSKVFCARRPIVKAMLGGGVEIIGDSRIENLKRIGEFPCRKMLLRIPMGSHAEEVVEYCDISLNSELDTIRKLSEAAVTMNRIHCIILMIDVGDLREGVLEEDAVAMVKNIITLPNIRLCGIGTNLTCYGGVIPDGYNLGRLLKIKENIKTETGLQLPLVSGGNSSSLYMVLKGNIPQGINQLRIGEAILLGKETSFGNMVPGCYRDCFTLKGEIVEIKFKPSVPVGNIGVDAFGEKPAFEDRGIMKRAIVAMGRQDITIGGLMPQCENMTVLGASSDHLLLDITKCRKELKVGDVVDFNMDYSCLLAAMTSPYVKKYYVE